MKNITRRFILPIITALLILTIIIAVTTIINVKQDEKISKLETKLKSTIDTMGTIESNINTLEKQIEDLECNCEYESEINDLKKHLENLKNNNTKSTSAKLLDIPLSKELQEYTIETSNKFGVPSELMFALMKVESNFKPNLISSTNDYGLCQINKINHSRLSKELGIKDFLDPKSSILAGTYIMSGYYQKYNGDLHRMLMAYNMGEAGARNAVSRGFTTSRYSRKVIENYNKYKN